MGNLKEILIGTYQMGGLNVELCWRIGTGGEFWFNPDKGKLPKIVIGMSEKDFSNALTTLIHEAIEFAATQRGARFSRSGDYGDSHDGYVFILAHPELSDVCGRVGTFIGECLPEFTTVWKVYNKGKK